MQLPTLRQAARAAGFGALTFACGTGVLIGVTIARGDEKKSAARDAVSGAWSRALIRLFGVELAVEGDAGAPGVGRGQGRVVVANHRSIIDICVMLAQFGGAVLSRGDLESWPIIGRAAKSAGTIFVDRSSKRSGAQAIKAMVERLRLHDTICIFPEGTTFEDDAVRPFKAGAFVAAKRAKTPVLPVGIVYPLDSGAAFGGESFTTHLSRLASTKRTRAYLEIGAELTCGETESVEDFAERARKEVERLVTIGRKKEHDSRSLRV